MVQRSIVVVAATVLASACGGGGGATGPSTVVPTAPPVSGWPSGEAVTLVAGDSGAPVAGATANVGGQLYSTDGAGRFVLTSAAAAGVTVDIQAPGYLTRQTTVRTGSTRLTLWPDSSELPQGYTQKLVYVDSSFEETGELRSMRRIASRIRTVAVAGDAPSIHDAVTIVNWALGGRGVTYQAGGTGDMTVSVTLDTSDPDCPGLRAYTSLTLQSQEIVACRVIVCAQSAMASASTMAHELGHTFGLRHSGDGKDLMYRSYSASRGPDFSWREVTTMGLMLLRRGGNTWPDNDRTAAATSGPREERIACP